MIHGCCDSGESQCLGSSVVQARDYPVEAGWKVNCYPFVVDLARVLWVWWEGKRKKPVSDRAMDERQRWREEKRWPRAVRPARPKTPLYREFLTLDHPNLDATWPGRI